MTAIQSMTAFARCCHEGQWGSLVWEVRSVNHRYLEMNVYLPDFLRSMEETIRDMARKRLARGKVDCSLRFEPGVDMETKISVNMPLARQLITAAEQINHELNDGAPISPLDILRWPRVIAVGEANLAAVQGQITQSFNTVLEQLTTAREREGKALGSMIEQRITAIANLVNKLKPLLPDYLQEQRGKLLQRFTEAKVELDPQRLEQEMVIVAQKTDVAEELDRLTTHVSEVERILQKGGSIGRRLDFLMQELNREANTLAAKSNHADMTQIAVEIKVLIEQMREQIQNIA